MIEEACIILNTAVGSFQSCSIIHTTQKEIKRGGKREQVSEGERKRESFQFQNKNVRSDYC